MLNGRRIRALRSSTSGHGSFRTRLLQRSSIVLPEAHYKAHGPRVSHTGSLFFNKIRRPPVRLGRNHVERRTRKTAVCGQRTGTPPKKRVNSWKMADAGLKHSSHYERLSADSARKILE